MANCGWFINRKEGKTAHSTSLDYSKRINFNSTHSRQKLSQHSLANNRIDWAIKTSIDQPFLDLSRSIVVGGGWFNMVFLSKKRERAKRQECKRDGNDL